MLVAIQDCPFFNLKINLTEHLPYFPKDLSGQIIRLQKVTRLQEACGVGLQ